MKKEQIMSGAIFARGKGFLDLDLEYGKPDSVIVEFRHNDPIHHPCNPHHDELEWEVEKRDHGFVLVLKWDVSIGREIVWIVNFVD